MDVVPALLARARQELGVRETPGPVSDARVIEYRKMGGLGGIQGDDSLVPWCAIFVNAMLHQVGLKGSGSAMARSFAHWGKDCPIGTPGAVTVISSPSRGPTAGHVFIATGRVTPTHVEGCGGNQDDAVTNAWWPIERVVVSRWPAELQPPVGKPILIAAAVPAKKASDA